jgi:acylpyruvate hydrolase
MRKIKLKNREEEHIIKKIICVGRNYADHAIELGNEIPELPLIFLKPTSSVIFSGGKILYPVFSRDMHHEVELVLLISKYLKNAEEKECEDAIAGYGVGLDMTLRDVQNELKRKGHPWTMAKCFDTSAVLSEFISSYDYNLTLHEEISLSVNGEIKQYDKLNKMLFMPGQLLQHISSIMTIEPGDLIFTGTPAGVGKVNPGDKLHAEITGVAELFCEVE